MLRSLRHQMLLGQFALVALLTVALGGGVFHVAASILEGKEREKVRLLAAALARESALTAERGETFLRLLITSPFFDTFHETGNLHLLQALFDRYRAAFTFMAYVNPQGVREYAASGPGYTDRDAPLAVDPLVTAALAEPGRIVHALRSAGAAGEPTLALALARRTPFGQDMGAIVAAGPVEALAEGVLSLRLARGGGAVLADGNGRLLFGEALPGLPDRIEPGTPLAQALAAGQATDRTEAFDGASYLLAAAPVGKYGLSAVVALPREAAIDGEIRRLRFWVAGVAAVAACLTTLVAAWWTGGIARPMARLAEAARVASGGDLGVRAPVGGPAEAREVALAFNAMAERLAASRQELSRAKHSLENILANVNEAILVVDRQGRLTMLNRAGERMLGYGPGEAVGLPGATFFPPGDPLRALLETADAQDLLASGGVSGLEKTLVGQGGRGVPVLVSLALLREPDRPGEGVICLAMDVTERRRAEALTRARRAAEAVSRAKTEFLAVVSHEMRTPLNIVLGILEHLRDQPLAPLSLAGIDQAMASGQTLREVIEAMLDYASLEAGRVLLRRQGFDPRRLAGETAERFATPARLRGLDLTVVVDADMPGRLIGDPARLGQVIGNLVSNAVRFTHDGTVSLRLSMSPEPGLHRPGARRRLLAAVTDTGEGVADDKLESIFMPFTQQDATATRRFGGLGLGLAIATRLVTLMDGSLCLVSRQGEGTQAWVSLPLEEDADA
ncbi:ATP-binding protein [Solidesulfovibrio sp.]|uniref:ATP-binding protein n=1 Tax=Solidesulfovibrio sp. TaxID=2910990 RepID=UPI002B201621|nr:ATP-binding protein [Solidesulfovibrio sp.]MEA4856238.1 ATP-binding protein [Solidesulfovibrio sp.]